MQIENLKSDFNRDIGRKDDQISAANAQIEIEKEQYRKIADQIEEVTSKLMEENKSLVAEKDAKIDELIDKLTK